MLYLEDKREASLIEITGMEETEVEKVFKTILEEYDDVVFWEIHNIENCRTIKHAIRLLDETLIVGKQEH